MSRKRNRSSATRKRTPKRTRPSSQPTVPVPSLKGEIPSPESNERQHLFIVPTLPPEQAEALGPVAPAGLPGSYTATFVLCIPGKQAFTNDLDIGKLLASGESLLYMPKEASSVVVSHITHDTRQDIIVSRNSSGALARAEMRLEASGTVDAQRKAYDLVMALLSWWSFRYEVALDVIGYRVVEERTGVEAWMLGVLGRPKQLAMEHWEQHVLRDEYNPLFASFREGMNSNNAFYQIICFYRVLEGIKKLRDVRRSHALSTAQSYTNPPDEQMPDSIDDIPYQDPFTRGLFLPYVSKKFNGVIDDLANVLRNAVAHLDPAGDSLVADRFDDVERCANAVYVMKYMCRIMLKNELNADPNVPGKFAL